MARQMTIWTMFNARDRVSPSVRKMGSNVDRFGRNSRRTFGGVNDSLRTMRRLAGIAVAVLTTGAIARQIHTHAQAADELMKAADRSGMSIEALQEIIYAADISAGLDSSQVIQGVERLNQEMSKLQRGEGQLYRILAAVNPQLALQARNAENVEQAFDAVMKAVREAPNDFVATEIAAAAFGRSIGPDMVNVARLGEEGLAELRKEAHEMGRVLDEESARKAEELNDSLTRLRGVLNRLKVDALTPVIDALIPIVDNMRAWIQENDILDGQNVQLIVIRILDEVRNLWTMMGNLVTRIREVNDEFDGKLLPGIAIAIGAFMALNTIVRLTYGAITLIKGIKLVGGIFALANPIGIAIVAVVGLVTALWWLKNNWDDVVERMRERWENSFIGQAIQQLDNFLDRFRTASDEMKEAAEQTSHAERAERYRPTDQDATRTPGTSYEDMASRYRPVSPNTGVIESHSIERSSVDVDINIRDDNNRADVQQKGTAPGLRLNLGGFF